MKRALCRDLATWWCFFTWEAPLILFDSSLSSVFSQIAICRWGETCSTTVELSLQWKKTKKQKYHTHESLWPNFGERNGDRGVRDQCLVEGKRRGRGTDILL
jgi:hypothetical protein